MIKLQYRIESTQDCRTNRTSSCRRTPAGQVSLADNTKMMLRFVSPLIALGVASAMCGSPSLASAADMLPFLVSGKPDTQTASPPGNCQMPQLLPDIAFKGGTAAGEEITVRIDTENNLYDIAIDASSNLQRQGTNRRGTLTADHTNCMYQLEGESTAPLRIDPRGILLGRIGGMTDGAAPVSFVAFRDTSNRLSDLVGNWLVSGRERAMNTGTASKPITQYELHVRPDGRLRQCAVSANAKDKKNATRARCLPVSGRVVAQGTVFRLLEKDGSDTSLILGKVDNAYVPILLRRGTSGQGLRVFASARTADDTQPAESSGR
jgi:hypothetical protein